MHGEEHKDGWKVIFASWVSDTFGIRCAFDRDEEEEEQRGLRDTFGQVGCLITFFLLIIRYPYCK